MLEPPPTWLPRDMGFVPNLMPTLPTSSEYPSRSSRANDILLSSRVILAEEAYEWGLVNDVHEKTQLWQETLDLTNSLANNVSPGSLASTKTQIYTDLHLDAASAVDNAAVLLEKMVAEPDFTEGVAAWLEKRQARWFRQ